MSKKKDHKPSVGTLQWARSAIWLLFLAPVFFISYGFANQYAAAHDISTSLYFEWERHIPFIPWTIVPYWSIDLLYGLSFLCCRTKQDVDRHGLRLLSAQIIAVTCFLLFPLRFAFDRPQTDGLWGGFFDALTSFDKPYNQAPSLHIALLILIWAQFTRLQTTYLLKVVVHAWALLIAVSVLTTWQHHFIDLPTGAALGLFCLWMWPSVGKTPICRYASIDSGRYKFAFFYALSAMIMLCVAIDGSALAWGLGWFSMAFGLVAWNYAWAGAVGFQKHEGRFTLASKYLFAPYSFCAWVNSRLWTLKEPRAIHIANDVWLGRYPSAADMHRFGFTGLFDLTAEFEAPKGDWRYANQQLLDLVTPTSSQLIEAARHIESLCKHGPVLVACALGYSRSAAAVAAWLCQSGRCDTVDEAMQYVAVKKPSIVINPAMRIVLAEVGQHA